MNTARIQPLDIIIALAAVCDGENVGHTEWLLDTGKDTPPDDDTTATMFVEGDLVCVARSRIDTTILVNVIDSGGMTFGDAERPLNLPGRTQYIADTPEDAERRTVTFESYARAIFEHYALGAR